MSELTETTTKENRLIDVHVEIDLEGMLWSWRYDTVEVRAEALEEAAQELMDFLNDHRSQDGLSIQVVREHITVCTACGETWEPDSFDGKIGCANCGAILQERQE